MSRKITRWDGVNKRKARTRKSLLVQQEIDNGFLPQNPYVLSFAGSKAHFERSLIARNLTVPENIVTIQTCQKIGAHQGGRVLSRLIKIRDNEFPGMLIWPYSFNSFSLGYGAEEVMVPAFSGKPPRWYANPRFRREMFNFVDRPAPRFSVVDADLCGVFSESNAGDLTRLLHKGAFAENCLLFVNHQKGRDGRFGKLFDFLRRYFWTCEYFDVDSIEDLDLSEETSLSFWYARYVLVPIHYICEAYDAGYNMEVCRLVEYRDRNPSSRAGVTMLQWYFKLKQRASSGLLAKGRLKDWADFLKRERAELSQQLELVSREAYPYTESID